MADLKRCDKCGCVRKTGATRPITVYFCNEQGICDMYGQIHWQGKDVFKSIKRDLCTRCWKEFVDKTYQYFNIQ